MQEVQFVEFPKQVAQGRAHAAQVEEFTSPYVPAGQLSIVTQVKLLRKLVEHEVHEELLVQLPQGKTQGMQIVEEL